MTRIKWWTVALAAAFASLQASAQIGYQQTVASYTGDSVFSQYGTNGNTGYTNTAVAVDTSRGKELAIQFQFYGYDDSATNAVVLAVRRANTQVAAQQETLHRWRVGLTAVPGAVATVITNITVGAASYVFLQVENVNESSLTNLTVKVVVK